MISILNKQGGVQPPRHLKADYLSKDRTDCLRGIFALFVVMHHLYQNTGLFSENTVLSMIFSLMGYLSVSVFFFLSGYGLMSGYERKGREYAKRMFVHRIIPFYIVSVFFSYLDMAGTLSFSWKRFLLTPIAFGNFGYLWYLEVQLFVYILFAVVYSWKITDELKNMIFFFGLLFMVIGFSILGLGGWWYNSIVCVFLGMIWKKEQTEIDGFIVNKVGYGLVLPASFILFCGLILSRFFYTGGISILVEYMDAIFFVLLVIMLIIIIPFENKLTRFLGSISLEIYALQRIFIWAFHTSFLNISNPWLYCVVVYGATIVAAAIVHPFINRFMSLKCWQK